MGDKMKIGISAKMFNFNMRNRRAEMKLSQKELSSLSGCDTQFISAIETLKMPYGNLPFVRDGLNRIAKALECDLFELFPQNYLDAIEKKLLPRKHDPVIWVTDISIEQLAGVSTEMLALPGPEEIAMDKVSQEQLKAIMPELLKELLPREREVIEMRFGIADGKEKTQDECGKILGICGARVGHIEAKALRKMRRHKFSDQLHEWAENG